MKYKSNLYSLRKRPVKLAKSSLSYLFLVQINFTFSENVRIYTYHKLIIIYLSYQVTL
jgi:hypothetical protein